MTKKQILVVDDSAFMRKMITDILNTSEYLEVCGTARNGKDALEKLRQWKPDLVTLDVEMPVMDGIETLKGMMRVRPTPVIMLSSLTKAGADKTVEAMSHGAVDFIAKPSGSISLNIKEIEQEIVMKAERAVEVKQQRLLPSRQPSSSKNNFSVKAIQGTDPIIAIGASTGGPRALQDVISQLPADLQAPIVIVQHMPRGFTKSLAERLNKLSKLQVKEVEHGDVIEKGHVYLAQGGKQFSVVRTGSHWTAKVELGHPVNGHQPAVDMLFESVANLRSCHPIAVVLTGMGSDGTNGLITLKKKHPKTIAIAQSEETCIVYGMPQAAVKTGLINYQADIHHISEVLAQKVPKQR
ncbi:protein-glutamate methylesterase/protein-glutamine glutaminase [Gracilibacillus phocaeensis]|uniref:protein-glutamate methylesterase/protein-glutamine glutaminase n=1 Tax=Gracilibacillus phocaeensis TaxID=2042304 RepID=UPI001030C311|nr:chemotaxis response regulator protein-glutamate methylesterase [Gracilibacillus phocaeensis]